MGLFITTGQTMFFSEPWREKQKTLFRHTEPGRYDGRQRLWYFLPPVGRLRPFCSTVLVDNAMGNAPYRRRHENRAGGGVEPNNPPWLVVSSSWAPPAMASTAAYGPSAPVLLDGAR